MNSISIVIATADRPQMVLDCIASFRAQVPTTVEVLVVDGGGDRPVDEEAVLSVWPGSRVVRSTVRNAGFQRNEGVRLARGEIIIFLDDDTLVQPKWWPAIVDGLGGERGTETSSRGQTPVAAIAGAVWVSPSPTFTDRPGGYVNLLGVPVQITHRSERAPRDVDWPLTTNMAVLKSAFEAVGGFALAYGIYDEDVDLGLKLRAAGYGIRFEPRAAVYHYYLKRPPRQKTKRSEFLLGRNRAMLLVRNFGVCSRLLLFLLVTPFVQLAVVFATILRSTYRSCGHAAAYVCGAVSGVVAGLRHPVGKDVHDYKEQSKR
jgi:GT2 family glycosyltransferase